MQIYTWIDGTWAMDQVPKRVFLAVLQDVQSIWFRRNELQIPQCIRIAHACTCQTEMIKQIHFVETVIYWYTDKVVNFIVTLDVDLF